MPDDALSLLFSFASPYHLAWFAMSMTALLAVTILDRALRLAGKAHLYALFAHVVVAIEAVIHEMIGHESMVFSVHCIWFNALMAVTHWILLARASVRTENDEDP